MRRTKIIATIGPATSSEQAIDALVVAGVDVFRINFSHGTHETHGAVIARVRAAAQKHGRHVALLQDLSGPKIRTGALRDGVALPLAAGDELRIVIGDVVGEPGQVSTTYPDLPSAVRHGDAVLLDDGRIQLRVEATSAREVTTRVVYGGLLGERKGINLPGIRLPSAALTPKDLSDLKFGVRAGVDWMGLSFVQSAEDLRAARRALREAGAPDLPLVAKLERADAVSQIDEILEAADAVMIARGDLGLELPLERVPRVQKDVTCRARALGMPVIVATQVLESMRFEPRPTRAEVSDAATAVGEGVDAIMLAGETAVGAHPVRAVETLDLIVRDAEAGPTNGPVPIVRGRLIGGHGRALCDAAVTLAAHGDASAMVAVTHGGTTARLLSALRPRVPIYAATDRPDIARQLVLRWGVAPILADLGGHVADAATRIGAQLVASGDIPPASVIAFVSITADLAPGPSNVLKLQRV